MIKRVALYAFAVSLGAVCCAQAQPSPPAANPGQAANPAQDAPAASSTPGAAAAPAAEEKGHIYFFRPSRLSGAFYTYHVVEVGDDGHPAKGAPHLADLHNGGAFRYDADPGIHSYNITGPMAVNKAEDRLRMEVEPGQTYYVEQTVRIGLVTGGFRLVPADQARFQSSGVKLAEPK